MLAVRRAPAHGVRRYVTTTLASASSTSQYGRTAAYRRLNTLSTLRRIPQTSSILRASLRSGHQQHAPPQLSLLARSLHSSVPRYQQPQPKEEVRDPPRPEEPEQKASEGEKAEDKTEDGKEEGKDKKNDDAPPPPPHGDKTPWQVFRDTMRTEFKASQEWNESTKQLSGRVQTFSESEGVRRAREASEAASAGASKVIKGTGKVIGQSAAWTWNTSGVQATRAGVNALGRGIEKASRPVRESKAFKDVSEAMDDGSSSRYGTPMSEKEERRRQREARELKEGRRRVEKVEEDPNAGTNVTLHKDSAWRESWNNYKDNSKLFQGINSMRNTYEESENPIILTARSITDRFAGFFAENETAQVIKKFREIDPNFQLEPFLRDMREYILPEVLDAYVKGDLEVLKTWLSAAQFQVYSALTEQYTKAGLKADGKILDIRGVDVLNARMLEPGDIPVFIVTCRTQEVHVYRNKKTNVLAAGMEDKVQQVTYAIGVTRLPEEVHNPETGGWRMIELQKVARDYY